MDIAVLVAAYNRKETTVKGIRSLVAALDCTTHSYDIYLLDDGSTDGTGSTIESLFPNVVVISGSGNLYWNRGMCKAYEASLVRNYDTYLLFNDDVELFQTVATSFFEAYSKLNASSPAILVGSTVGHNSNDITYSAFYEKSRVRALAFEAVGSVTDDTECDTFNGNFVAIPADFFHSVGGLDPGYHHGLGDIDLGLTAKRSGVRSVLFHIPVGKCDRGKSLDERLARASYAQRYTVLFAPPNHLGPYLHFVWKHRPRFLFPFYLVTSWFKKVLKLHRLA